MAAACHRRTRGGMSAVRVHRRAPVGTARTPATLAVPRLTRGAGVRNRLTDYERQVKAEIAMWRANPPGRVARTLGAIEKPLVKPVGWVLEKTTADRAIKGALELVMDAGSWTVDEDRILA